ncbi:hypothetical protein SY26_10405 [Paracoccus sp. 228]|nr:hypothetical protein SY26_10405 [Paracoccus sp. 228]
MVLDIGIEATDAFNLGQIREDGMRGLECITATSIRWIEVPSDRDGVILGVCEQIPDQFIAFLTTNCDLSVIRSASISLGRRGIDILKGQREKAARDRGFQISQQPVRIPTAEVSKNEAVRFNQFHEVCFLSGDQWFEAARGWR